MVPGSKRLEPDQQEDPGGALSRARCDCRRRADGVILRPGATALKDRPERAHSARHGYREGFDLHDDFGTEVGSLELGR